MFFLPHLQTPHTTDDSASAAAGPVKRMKYVSEGVRWRGKEGEREEGIEEGKEEGVEEKESKGEERGVGSALGPDWHTGRSMRGSRNEVQCPGAERAGRGPVSFPLPQGSRPVHVEYQCEVKCLLTAEEVASRGLQPSEISADPLEGSEVDRWPVYTILTNGKVFGCDLVVSATGTEANTSCVASDSGKVEVCVDRGGEECV